MPVTFLSALPRRVSALVASWLVLASPVAAGEALPVVELFTSQGCSSCPPADKYLGELAKRRDVIALSYHVDYWDYIGWPDPFATKATTRRQHDYGQALKQRYVYTPELVVDGRGHSSRPDDVAQLIAAARERPRLDVALEAEDPDMPKVTIPAGDYDGRASVWMVFYDRQHETRIGRGENRGRTLTYSNVVREIRHIGTWTGRALTLPVSIDEARSNGRGGCAVIVQDGRAGRILGAAKMDIDG